VRAAQAAAALPRPLPSERLLRLLITSLFVTCAYRRPDQGIPAMLVSKLCSSISLSVVCAASCVPLEFR
jgi:hypothetical protein